MSFHLQCSFFLSFNAFNKIIRGSCNSRTWARVEISCLECYSLCWMLKKCSYWFYSGLCTFFMLQISPCCLFFHFWKICWLQISFFTIFFNFNDLWFMKMEVFCEILPLLLPQMKRWKTSLNKVVVGLILWKIMWWVIDGIGQGIRHAGKICIVFHFE